MRFIILALLVTGCSRSAAPVAPPAPTTTVAASCGADEPAPVEVKKPEKKVFALEVCR